MTLTTRISDFLIGPATKTPCQLGYHAWELVIPRADRISVAKCNSCGIRVSVEDATRNREWQKRELAKR